VNVNVKLAQLLPIGSPLRENVVLKLVVCGKPKRSGGGNKKEMMMKLGYFAK